MEKITCKNCGTPLEDNAMFCSKCGEKRTIEENKPTPSAIVQETPTTKSHSGLNKVLTIVAIVLIVICSVITGVVTRNIDNKTLKTGETTLGELTTKLTKTKKDLKESQSKLKSINGQIEIQSKNIKPLEEFYDKSLAMGTYTVGVDLQPGIYHLMYTSKTTGYNWGDSIYILNSNSKGSHTNGHIKYDTSVEARDDGEVSVKFSNGDTVTVETEYGNWLPARDASTSSSTDE